MSGETRTKKWWLGAAVAVLTLAAGAAAAAGARAAGDAGNVSIMVLGDSYSAGNGAGGYGSRACWRSPNNYGAQYARLLQAPPYNQDTTVRTVACSGAVTHDIASPNGPRPAQLDALNGDYDIVALTIGGNDAHFGTIVRSCLVVVDAAPCDAALTTAEKMVSDGTIEGRLTNVLAGIRARTGPATRIVLLGYPYLEGDAGYVVPSNRAGVGPVAAGRRVRALTDAADRLEQKVVDGMNAKQGTDGNVFVSVKQRFAGHELLAQRTNPARWFIAPFTDAPIGDLDVWYHPNPAGYLAEAQLLLADPRVPKADVG
jgi:lysophospholipase L1-like esterase